MRTHFRHAILSAHAALRSLALGLTATLATAATAPAEDAITTIVGGGPRASDPTHVAIGTPSAVAIGPDGTLYWGAQACVMRRLADGTLAIVAGSDEATSDGEGGPATQARLGSISSLALSAHGDLFISEGYRVRRVAHTTGVITTVAGGGASLDDGVPATAATLYDATAIALDAADGLFIADASRQRVRKVDAVTGIITTVAGNGTYPVAPANGDLGPAIGPTLMSPSGLAVAASGDLYIADNGTSSVRRVDHATGIITTVAGSGAQGFSGDGGAATAAALAYPFAVAVAGSGDLYIADSSNNRVRRVAAATGLISTVAGGPESRYNGDGIPATSAGLEFPQQLALDGHGDLFIADQYHLRVREVDAGTGLISTVAGNGQVGYSGDGAAATGTRFARVAGVAYGPSGDLYVVAQSDNRICRVAAATGVVTTIAGTGENGYAGDGGPARDALLYDPVRIAFDQAGDMIICDQYNNRIRKLTMATGVITTIAGAASPSSFSGSFSGDGGPALTAGLCQPVGLRLAANGDIVFTDMGNQRVRRIAAATGIITTIAGSGPRGANDRFIPGAFSGDGGPATSAQFSSPVDVVIESTGDILVDDMGNNRIRRISAADGTITTIAGADTLTPGDGGPALAAGLYYPTALLLDPAGNLLISCGGHDAIRRIDHTTGVITTIAGHQVTGFSGDGGPATAATLNRPTTLCFDPAGNLLISDGDNGRIRRLAPPGPDHSGGSNPPPATAGGGGGGGCGLGSASALLVLSLGCALARTRSLRSGGPGARP